MKCFFCKKKTKEEEIRCKECSGDKENNLRFALKGQGWATKKHNAPDYL